MASNGGDETWASIQQVMSKRESFREKLKRRRAERDTILSVASGSGSSSPVSSPSVFSMYGGNGGLVAATAKHDTTPAAAHTTAAHTTAAATGDITEPIERALLCVLCDSVPPITVDQLLAHPRLKSNATASTLKNTLKKMAYKELLSVSSDGSCVESVQHDRLAAALERATHGSSSDPLAEEPPHVSPPPKKLRPDAPDADDVMSLLSAPSIRERETKRIGAEILELLNKPTAKEQSVAQHFRSQGGAKVREFCPRGTAEDCVKWRLCRPAAPCGKLHFRKIIQHHTDESLGDCSFLNTCFHMDTCRYVHYEVDYSGTGEEGEGLALPAPGPRLLSPPRRSHDRTVLFPPQWIQCDLRFLDMAILGKFSVIMADPPWDIHMELPYGTMSDDEMRQLNIPALQDEGLIFLWVTGRAMELGRECLTLWGYERVDEIIWVKTNQLQRIIRTGRTGHWLNHGKEHCLVGMKGKPKINRCMDCDVIVAEVRATSHKPDEIYGIIERLSPGTRKIELFGRHHNVQPNWLTLGNQLEGVNLLEEDLIRKFKEHHPDGVTSKQ